MITKGEIMKATKKSKITIELSYEEFVNLFQVLQMVDNGSARSTQGFCYSGETAKTLKDFVDMSEILI